MAGRSRVFARSDIRDAAEQFVIAISEHADDELPRDPQAQRVVVMWEQGDTDQLAEALADAAFAVLRDPDTTFGTKPA